MLSFGPVIKSSSDIDMSRMTLLTYFLLSKHCPITWETSEQSVLALSLLLPPCPSVARSFRAT